MPPTKRASATRRWRGRESAEPCPQPCPELSNSDPLQLLSGEVKRPYLRQKPWKWVLPKPKVASSSLVVRFGFLLLLVEFYFVTMCYEVCGQLSRATFRPTFPR
jgi:hypothetical protein